MVDCDWQVCSHECHRNAISVVTHVSDSQDNMGLKLGSFWVVLTTLVGCQEPRPRLSTFAHIETLAPRLRFSCLQLSYSINGINGMLFFSFQVRMCVFVFI